MNRSRTSENHRHASIMLATGAVALLLAACGSNGTTPAQLQLASRNAGAAEQALAASSSIRQPAGVPTPAPTTTWPPTPTDGPVLTPTSDSVSTARVQALALALGITAPVVEKKGGWIAPADASEPLGRPRLIVLKDSRSTWSYGTSTSCNLDQPVADAGGCTSSVTVATPDAVPAPGTTGAGSSGTGSSGTSSGSTGSSGTAPTDSVTPVPRGGSVTLPPTTSAPTTPVADEELRRLAAPVLAAAGLTSDATTTTTGTAATDAVRSITAEPVVAGLPTSGAGTTVTVIRDSSGLRVSDADGSLAGWRTKDTYGVISALTGLDRLAALPQPAIAELCPQTKDGTGCVPRPTPTIVGARFGLMADIDGTAPVLAPAWLYDTTVPATDATGKATGALDDAVIAISAVQDRYLAPPPTASNPVITAQPAPPPGAVPGFPGPGGSTSGNPGPNPAGTPESKPTTP